jgi:tRNA1Val (adenine37-N6)-methyltransferase
MKRLLWNEAEETLDTLFGGRLKILQKKRGYRFSVDALLLAFFTEPGPDDRIIDLGTGCGVVPLVLFFRKKAKKITGVEIQPSLADLARRNAVLNRCSSRFQVWEEDLRKLDQRVKREGFDLVLTNPPYRKAGSGRVNPHTEKAVARHELQTTLTEVLRSAHYLLVDKGRLAMIYPASRVADLMRGLSKYHLEPKRMQFVHSHEGNEARLVLVEALKEGHTQVQVLPPFFLYDSSGNYTPAARELFE